MAVGIVAKLTIQSGKGAEFEAAFAKCQEAVRATEPGCQLYTLGRDKTNPDVYFVMEQYADQAARETHASADAVREAMKPLGGLLAAAPELTEIEIVREM